MKAVTSSHPQVRTEAVRSRIPCAGCESYQCVPFCSENGLGLVKCSQCGLVYVSQRPETVELYNLYDETYYQNETSGIVGYTNYIADEANIRRTFSRRLKRLERFVPARGMALDVGCAMGFFLSEAQNRGWNVQGLDISPYAAEYARERFGIDVRQGSLLDLDYPENAYDLISLWDVIEHVPNPKAYVTRAAALLKPGGVIALATPDVGSLPARLTGKRWIGYKLSEEHLYYFSRETLSQMLERAGFDIVDVYHVGKYVTIQLFLDRLGAYAPLLANPLTGLAQKSGLSEQSVYVNPFDIIAITARKR